MMITSKKGKILKMKKEVLKEAILLEEPIEELPNVEVPTIEIEEPEVDKDIKENAMTSLLASEVAKVYSTIDNLKSILSTISFELPDRDDVTSIINQIIDDETIHVGMLQKAIDLIDGKSEELIDAGNEAASIALVNDKGEE